MAYTMSLPKYTVCKRLSDGKYTISKKGEVIKVCDDASDAHDECQRYIEDDNWNAANRD